MDDGVCPLCLEDMDPTDLLLASRLCQCRFAVCLWCFRRLTEDAAKESRAALCPNCREPYDIDRITQEGGELNPEQLEEVKRKKCKQDDKKKTAAAPKVRKDLTNVRVVRRNLVYIVGLPPSVCHEDLLSSHELLGKYGKIIKISVSRSAPYNQSANKNISTGTAYITYKRNEDAKECIESIHGTMWEGKHIKACYGTTKYCNAFLRGVPCNNVDCLYLHESAQDCDSYTKEETKSLKFVNLVHAASIQTMSLAADTPPSNSQDEDLSTARAYTGDDSANMVTSHIWPSLSTSEEMAEDSTSPPPAVRADVQLGETMADKIMKANQNNHGKEGSHDTDSNHNKLTPLPGSKKIPRVPDADDSAAKRKKDLVNAAPMNEDVSVTNIQENQGIAWVPAPSPELSPSTDATPAPVPNEANLVYQAKPKDNPLPMPNPPVLNSAPMGQMMSPNDYIRRPMADASMPPPGFQTPVIKNRVIVPPPGFSHLSSTDASLPSVGSSGSLVNGPHQVMGASPNMPLQAPMPMANIMNLQKPASVEPFDHHMHGAMLDPAILACYPRQNVVPGDAAQFLPNNMNGPHMQPYTSSLIINPNGTLSMGDPYSRQKKPETVVQRKSYVEGSDNMPRGMMLLRKLQKQSQIPVRECMRESPLNDIFQDPAILFATPSKSIEQIWHEHIMADDKGANNISYIENKQQFKKLSSESMSTSRKHGQAV